MNNNNFQINPIIIEMNRINDLDENLLFESHKFNPYEFPMYSDFNVIPP